MGNYQRKAFEASHIAITVIKRTDKQVKGFIVLPKRWVVERTLGWINQARRLSKDYEATMGSALAWLQTALAFLIMRRLARPKTAPNNFESGSKQLRSPWKSTSTVLQVITRSIELR